MKILVVEDNQKLARLLKRALEEEGYVVDLVADGATALGQLGNVNYDAVVLDWMLPEVDGLTVCRDLRARGNQVPILMLTARGEVPERIAGLNAGADDYLAKPFDLGEFLARVRARVRRGADAAVLRVGPLTIDRNERRALVNGQRLGLTPREFALLAYLAREAGRVVPRTELLVKVWEMTFDPGSNVVEVHVRNLRDKLGEHAGLIQTVRGVGYKVEAG
jgi:two-component system, OmpR family, response regulator